MGFQANCSKQLATMQAFGSCYFGHSFLLITYRQTFCRPYCQSFMKYQHKNQKLWLTMFTHPTEHCTFVSCTECN